MLTHTKILLGFELVSKLIVSASLGLWEMWRGQGDAMGVSTVRSSTFRKTRRLRPRSLHTLQRIPVRAKVYGEPLESVCSDGSRELPVASTG